MESVKLLEVTDLVCGGGAGYELSRSRAHSISEEQTACCSGIQSFEILVSSSSESHLVVSDSCDPMVCSLPGSSVHGILQERILEWVAIPCSRDLPNPGIEPKSPALQADFFFF